MLTLKKILIELSINSKVSNQTDHQILKAVKFPCDFSTCDRKTVISGWGSQSDYFLWVASSGQVFVF